MEVLGDLEEERRRRWQLHELRKLGFNRTERLKLVDARVSWREAKELLDKNCPHHLAVKILV